DVVEHGPERVVGALVAGRHLDRLGDRYPERARVVLGVGPPRLRFIARRAMHLGPPRLHHRAAVGLLVVARADHEDLTLEVEEAPRKCRRGAPLPGAGLGDQTLDARLLVLERLRDGAVGLVRSGRRAALVLVIDVRRRIERALETAGAEERRRPPALVDV